MKKKIFKLLTGMLLSCALAGSTVAVQAEEAGTDTVKSYLTGEDVSVGIGHRRPIAVMLGNDTNGAPQSGTENAGVIYEAPVEGSITRLMAIIEDYDNIPRIGSVRSCRDYFLFYANEYDAIYSHYGQAVYALQYLDQHLIDNLNGLTLGNAYYRSTDRVAPHNAYTDFSHLQAGIQSQGYSQDYKEDYNGHFQFAPEGTAPHIDQNTGNQLTCENIILQYSNYVPYDPNGYLNVDTQSGGEGKYITRGKAIDIHWTKDSQWGITHYYDSNNQEIQLNPGKTWVEIVLNDSVGSVSLQ